MQEQGGRRGVEWFVRCPESAPKISIYQVSVCFTHSLVCGSFYQGSRPSFANSWLRREWAKLTASTLPKLLRATKAGRLRAPALLPKTFRKKRPATITSLFARSDLGIAAK